MQIKLLYVRRCPPDAPVLLYRMSALAAPKGAAAATSCPRTLPNNIMSPTVSLPLILLVAVASGKVHEELGGLNQQPFKACIDDSDCDSDKGAGFACFQYICYPWKDDSAIAVKDK